MKDLFKPFDAGNLMLKNRFIRSATHDGLVDSDGLPTRAMADRFTELAAGGVGTIITGLAGVHRDGSTSPHMMMASDDAFISAGRAIVRPVHAAGAKVVLQLAHGGSAAGKSDRSRRFLAPSAVQHPASRITPREMTESDIADVASQFADAAMRAQEAGFDGVQIHAAHGYLISQFLTPFFNRRHDAWGGSIENRARFPLEIIRAIRATTGRSYALWIKINCDDFMQSYGLEESEALAVARLLDQAGVDMIEVSGGSPLSRTGEGTIRGGAGGGAGESWFRRQAAAVASAARCPVALVGGNRSLETMQQIALETPVALFSMSRPLNCEPALIRRWEAGDLRPARCTSCNGCFHSPDGRCVVDASGRPAAGHHASAGRHADGARHVESETNADSGSQE